MSTRRGRSNRTGGVYHLAHREDIVQLPEHCSSTLLSWPYARRVFLVPPPESRSELQQALDAARPSHQEAIIERDRVETPNGRCIQPVWLRVEVENDGTARAERFKMATVALDALAELVVRVANQPEPPIPSCIQGNNP